MTDQVTGEQLFDELCAAATSAGVGVGTFAAPLFPTSWKIEQMRIAHKPKAETVEQVRALIAGDYLPPRSARYIRDERALGMTRVEAEAAGIPPSQRSMYEGHLLNRAAETKQRDAIMRDIGEQAHATRRPGQTLADRARELRREYHL